VGVTNVLPTVVDTKRATAQASANVTVVNPDFEHQYDCSFCRSCPQGRLYAVWPPISDNGGGARVILG